MALSSQYPDNTGFHFDLPPRNIGDPMQEREEFYGAKYVSTSASPGAKPWLNWPDKFEPDPRFLAISDKNAHLQQFPEVDSPWKFTEYVFRGDVKNGKMYDVIEPPLFYPMTLTVCNGVATDEDEEKRFEGKIKSNTETAYKDLFMYKGESGTEYKEEDLDAGIVKGEIRHKPWFDPDAPEGKGRLFVKAKKYSTVKEYKYKTSSSGVRMYKKYVPVKSAKMGAHGNIPKHVVNMLAPKEYFEPDTMYSNRVVPRLRATIGNALVAKTDGIIDYKSGGELVGIRKVVITTVPWWSKTSGDGVVPQIWKPEFTEEGEYGQSQRVEQPRLQVFNGGPSTADLMLKTKLVATGFQDDDFVHKGCAFFKGDKNSCRCTIEDTALFSGEEYSAGEKTLSGGSGSGASINIVSVSSSGGILSVKIVDGRKGTGYVAGEILTVSGGNGGRLVVESVTDNGELSAVRIINHDNPNAQAAVPDPFKCTLYPSDNSYDPKGYYYEQGGKCPYYQHNGPREVALYETEASRHEDIIMMLSNASPWTDAGITRSSLESESSYNACMTSSSFLNSMGFMGGGTMYFGLRGLMAAGLRFGGDLSKPRSMADTEPRWTVEYEYIKVEKDPRKTYKTKWQSKPDYETVVRGTGRTAIDRKDTSYGGVDVHFFDDVNLLSSWRFNQCVMPCYSPTSCNETEGQRMQQGYVPRKFAGDNGRHCRYYGTQCPFSGVPRRAYEYDRQYSDRIGWVLKPFRMLGLKGFRGLREYKFSGKDLIPSGEGDTVGVFVAVGARGSLPILGIDDVNDYGDTAFFYYDNSVYGPEEAHKKSRVFVHLTQQAYDGSVSKIPLPAESRPSKYPENIPWLVELYDDYVSPAEFLSFAVNERPFFGGRHPEYKDYTRMGDEVICTMGGGGNIYGIEGGSTPELGGDPKHAATQDKGYYMGYRIDKTGEYIVDGRSIGTVGEDGKWVQVGTEPRSKAPPGMYEGATPIKGDVGNTIISAEVSRAARASNVWIYSSDYRETIDEMPLIYDDEGMLVRMNKPVAGILPTERKIYRCPKCNYDYMNWKDPEGNDYTKPEKPSFPSVDFVVTDLECKGLLPSGGTGQTEAPNLDGKCPVCGETLLDQGYWTNFPEVHAKGIVSVWGLPGEEVRMDGIFWKNPTLINRGIISFIRGKLGPLENGKYALQPTKSANATEELSVSRYMESHPIWRVGLAGATEQNDLNRDGTVDGTETWYSRDDNGVSDAMEKATPPMNGYSNDRPPEGKYVDNQISPYDSGVNGLDFISMKTIKLLRNAMSPLMSYEVGASSGADYFTRQQAGHRDRYGHEKNRKPYIQKGRLKPEVVAASQLLGWGMKCRDQFSQFWDGTLYPAVLINHYWPTGPTWWRLHQYVGGISRHGGTAGHHLDNSSATGPGGSCRNWYTGDNIISKAFYFLHGWLPMDKDVVKAVAIYQPICHPDAPSLGVVWSGVAHHEHYHAFLDNEGDIGNDYGGDWNLEHDAAEGRSSIVRTTEQGMTDGCVSYMWNMDDAYAGRKECIKRHNDKSFGTNASSTGWSGYLSWAGAGAPIVQTVTEAELWKKYTYQEFQDIMERQKCECRLSCDDPETGGVADDCVIFSKTLLDNIFLNETQNIPSYFDMSGMNSKLLYPKDGPVIEPKRGNSDWASGGQIIVQSSTVTPVETQPKVWNEGGLGNKSGGWAPRVIDITEVVKKKYNARLNRAYRIKGGMAFSDLHSYNASMKTYTGDNPTVDNMNYQHFDPNYGFWLNDAWGYPATDSDSDFPDVLSGDKYQTKPITNVPPQEDKDKNIALYSVYGWQFEDATATLYFKQIGSGEDARWYIYLSGADRESGSNSVAYVPASEKEVFVNLVSQNESKWSGDAHIQKLLEDGAMFSLTVDKNSVEQTFGRVISTSSGGWRAKDGTNQVFNDYYTYHPSRLMMSDKDSQVVGSKPKTGNNWISFTDSNVPAFFTVDLLQMPICKDFRNYRYKKEYWDISNAHCRNVSCPIGSKNKPPGNFTMAQYAELTKSSDFASSVLPSMHVPVERYLDNNGNAQMAYPKCPSCRSGRTLQGTGEIYVAGDGIPTYEYGPEPDRDVFIKAVKIKPYATIMGEALFEAYHCSVSVEVRANDESRWQSLFKIEYNSDTEKWRYGKYNDNKEFSYAEYDSLPDAFVGEWVDADNLENVKAEDLSGKHFIVPKARYIRVTAYSDLDDLYHPDAIGGQCSDLKVDGNIVTVPDAGLTEDAWSGGYLEFSFGDFLGEDTGDYWYRIVSNSGDKIIMEESVDVATGPTKWRLRATKYQVGCSQFEVYGYRTNPGDVVITGNPTTYLCPLVDYFSDALGITEVILPDLPSRIISVKSGSSDISDIVLTEYAGKRTDENFAWTGVRTTNKSTNESYYVIRDGKYMFDPSTRTLYIPGKFYCADDKYKCSVWTLNSTVRQDTIRTCTIPKFIEARYIVGTGVSLNVDAEAIGTGPSYQVEKDAISNIAGNEPFTSTSSGKVQTPEDIVSQLAEIEPKWAERKLPAIGMSENIVTLADKSRGKERMFWQVYNHEPMTGEFSMGFIQGDEMRPGGWRSSAIASLFGGETQERAGLKGSHPSKINGRVSGKIELCGAPKSIIFGNFYVYAKAVTKRTYVTTDRNTGGTTQAVTYERTGGLKYTGFSLGAELLSKGSSRSRKGMCFGVPRVLVYLRERDNTKEPETE